VTPGAAYRIVVTAPATAQAGSPVSITVTVVDAYNNVVTGYAGTVSFQSTDAAAALPSSYTFDGSDDGTHTFQVTFWTPGVQTIEVSDLADALIASALRTATKDRRAGGFIPPGQARRLATPHFGQRFLASVPPAAPVQRSFLAVESDCFFRNGTGFRSTCLTDCR
jgi:hypothetical protein